MALGFAKSARKASRRSRNARRHLQCEFLESRQLLAVVTSLDDSGPGTLREALQQAAVNEVITFDVSGTINTVRQLFISRSLTIDGSGQSVTVNNTVTGQRVFNHTAGEATIKNLTITGGEILDSASQDMGGAIRSAGGMLTVQDSVISDSIARVGGAIGIVGSTTVNVVNSTLMNNEGREAAGAVDVPASATLNVTGSTIEGNVAGIDSDQTFLSIGGGVRVFGTVTITDSILRSNTASTEGAGTDLGYGGAVGVTEGGALTIENTEISGNMSDRGGGVTARGATGRDPRLDDQR